MRPLSLVLAALSLLVLASTALAGNWSLGTNLGISFYNPEDGGDLTFIAIPSSAVFFQPGLRAGFTGTNSPHEFYLDTGVSDLDGDVTRILLTGNYQYNFASKTSTSFYLTGGLGFANVSIADRGATSLMVGAGAGARFQVANGHGSIRTELRYDRVAEGDDGGIPVIDEAGLIGFKFGFDLWMK
jgi:hypothetical protein